MLPEEGKGEQRLRGSYSPEELWRNGKKDFIHFLL